MVQREEVSLKLLTSNIVRWWLINSSVSRLILPEAFLWHVFHSMANALLYCAWGRGGKSGLGERKDWDQICHGDIKEQNVLMADVDEDQHKFYPCIKLCDFGGLSST